MDKSRIRVGITHGDVNGVGYEVILKTFADERIAELCTPVIYGSQNTALYHQKVMNLSPVNFNVIRKAEEAVKGKVNLINCAGVIKIGLARPSSEAGIAAFKALEAAVADVKRGVIDTLLTAPINKHTISNKNFPFPGHTEYLEKQFRENETQQALMILIHDSLRVALVTGHLPLAEVKSHLTQPLITNKLILLNHSLKQDFGVIKPRIAVLALNPHAGDNGLLGTEEKSLIVPAIREAEKKDVMAFGPYAADGFFGSRAYGKFDGVLAMYHDQGLAPFKVLAMENGVNYTAGLSIVRTSPAHGTAYDIAGQGRASEASFRQALYCSLDLFRNRKIYQEMTAASLCRQYVDSGGDNVTPDWTGDEMLNP